MADAEQSQSKKPMVDVDGIKSAGISAAVVNVITEALYPLVVLLWATCPVRLVALSVCALATSTGTWEGSTMRKIQTWLLATICLYAAALGVNKGVSEVRDEIQRPASALERPLQPRPAQEKPRRPGDPW